MKNLSKIGSGSSKDLFENPAKPALIYFQFTDRVSVFDYGPLPDAIINKGENLFKFALKIEELFRREKIKTLYDEDETKNSGLFAMKRALHPKFQASGAQTSEIEWQFIPLEVIFRWGAPKGSSLLKRDPSLKPWQKFPKPRVEFTTKLESTDRLLDAREAQELLGAMLKLEDLSAFAGRAAEVLKKYFEEKNLELWDGKFELAYHRQTKELALVDAISPDELRLTLPGLHSIPLSKELLRQWLQKTNWAFYLADKKRREGPAWKRDLPKPPRLGSWRVQKLSELYEALRVSLESQHSNALIDWVRRGSLKPKVAVVGGGGREAALKWRLESEGAEVVFFPSSSGLFSDLEKSTTRPEVLEKYASLDAVFLSQDADLEKSLGDRLEMAGFWVYGALREAAKIEWSKSFGREVATQAGLQVPRFTKNLEVAKTYLRGHLWPVVKFDGLAAGKGVVVPSSEKSFLEAAALWKQKGEVLFEERLEGFEASAFFGVECGHSGVKTHFLGTAQDFKRRYAGDEGPNTGGMGSLAPHPKVTPDDEKLFSEWAQKSAEVLEKQGLPYNGILYLGLMKDPAKGWALIEYNARPGDPETQALMLSWAEGQESLRFLLGLTLRCEMNFVAEKQVVCLSLVRPEYPDAPQKNISLPEWNFPRENPEGRVELFSCQSQSGRVAYLVAATESYLHSGDLIFEKLTHSPWKELLEWRADILS